MNLYKVMAVPALCGSECCLSKQQDVRIKAAESKLLRDIAGSRESGCCTNQTIREEYNIIHIVSKIVGYEENW
jgi:hypothetical protein